MNMSNAFIYKIKAKYLVVTAQDDWDDDLLRAIYSYTESHSEISPKEKEILKKGIKDHGTEKTLYRGLNGDFSHLKIDDFITMNGLISCTENEDVAYKFAKGKSLDKPNRHKAGAVITLTEQGLPITQGRFDDEEEYLIIGQGNYYIKEIDFNEKAQIHYITVY